MKPIFKVFEVDGEVDICVEAVIGCQKTERSEHLRSDSLTGNDQGGFRNHERDQQQTKRLSRLGTLILPVHQHVSAFHFLLAQTEETKGGFHKQLHPLAIDCCGVRLSSENSFWRTAAHQTRETCCYTKGHHTDLAASSVISTTEKHLDQSLFYWANRRTT